MTTDFRGKIGQIGHRAGSDGRVNIANDFTTSCGNLVRSGLVTPEFTGLDVFTEIKLAYPANYLSKYWTQSSPKFED